MCAAHVLPAMLPEQAARADEICDCLQLWLVDIAYIIGGWLFGFAGLFYCMAEISMKVYPGQSLPLLQSSLDPYLAVGNEGFSINACDPVALEMWSSGTEDVIQWH